MSIIKTLLQLFSACLCSRQVYKHQMVICISRNNLNSACFQTVTECFRIFNNLLHICFILRLKCFLEANCLTGDHMHQRTSLNSREYSFVEIEFLIHLFAAHDHSTSWSTECLMCCCCCHMRIRNRTWMKSCSNKSCDVCDIYHQICSHLICDLTETLEINCSCISTCSCNDQFRFMFLRNTKHFIIIDHAVCIHSVMCYIKIFTGHINR